jgi:Holliday junction DNA helicase RuvA
MIGRLRGAVAEIGEEEALIDVSGVGYVARCGSRTLARLPEPGAETTLQIEPIWTDQGGLRLYGFLSRDDRRAFTDLLQIQGVGPKAALAVLDVLGPAELMAAAERGDKAAVARANGVGPKLALRIVTELRQRPIASEEVAKFHAGALPGIADRGTEAVAALLGLGVAEPTARRLVDQALGRLGEGAAEPALIKAALQELGR